MKYCILAPHVIPGCSSALERTLLISEGLAKINGNSVDLVIPRRSSNIDKIQSKHINCIYLYTQVTDKLNINNKKGRYISRVLTIFFHIKSILLKRYDVFIYYSGGGIETLIYSLLSKAGGQKFCSHFADPLPENSSAIKRKIVYSIWGLNTRLSSVVIVISTKLKGLICLRHRLANTIIIPILINKDVALTDEKDCNSSQKEENLFSTVVYSGKLTTSSGIMDLLSAVELQKDIQWKLMISGPLVDNSKRHIDIQKEILDRHLEDRVTYKGYLDYTDYINFINSSDVLVVPKSEDEINHYNFPGKLAEFLMTQKPVILASIGDASLYLRDGVDVIFYPPGNQYKLYESIMYIINDRKIAKRIGISGRNSAIKQFSNDKWALALQDKFNII
jgi:glycosyltransferase involved in cell wall biosynthesis